MTTPSGSDVSVRVRASLDALVQRSRTPGIQYRAVGPEGALFAYDGGWADLARRIPMTRETTMMAYSMSKTITAVSALQLVATGSVGLDDPVERYAPTPYGREITVRQLLAHLSGIPNPIPLRWVHPVTQHASFDERRALGAEMATYPRLAFAAGTKFRYSNLGYWLLGEVIAVAAHRRFETYVAERVLAPLGIAAQDLGYAIPDSAPHANGYLEKYSFMNLAKNLLIDRQYIGSYEGRWLRIEPHYLNGPAFGGLVGTANGFAAFLRDQLQPRSALFDAHARELFYEPQRTSKGRAVPMTLGWHIGSLHGRRFFFKEGGGGGFHCEMRVYPTPGVGSVVMTNATGFDVKGCLNALDREFLG
jgi:CubicO group peptidase (beta-lactamase class C family)